MSWLNQTIDLGTALKAGAFVLTVGGGAAVLKDDISDLDEGKASNERVAIVETRQEEVGRATLRELQVMNARLAVIEGKLDGKVDKP